MRWQDTVRTAGVIAIAIVVGGCGAMPTQNIGSAADLEDAKPGESLVAGRIHWSEDGEVKDITDKLVGTVALPMLIRLEDQVRTWGVVAKDGSFVWSLEPGHYLIEEFQYRSNRGARPIVPRVAFAVPEAGGIYCIGTLRVYFDNVSSDVFMIPEGDLSIAVVDEYDECAQRLTRKLSIQPTEVQRAMMFHDSRLPDTINWKGRVIQQSLIDSVIGGLWQY